MKPSERIEQLLDGILARHRDSGLLRDEISAMFGALLAYLDEQHEAASPKAGAEGGDVCEECDGTGDSPRECEACNGTGKPQPGAEKGETE